MASQSPDARRASGIACLLITSISEYTENERNHDKNKRGHCVPEIHGKVGHVSEYGPHHQAKVRTDVLRVEIRAGKVTAQQPQQHLRDLGAREIARLMITVSKVYSNRAWSTASCCRKSVATWAETGEVLHAAMKYRLSSTSSDWMRAPQRRSALKVSLMTPR